MIPCSSCGYHFEKSQLSEKATGNYCKVCTAIGGARVNENPHQFGDARYFLPALGYCTNLLMAAISTRMEAGESGTSETAGRKAFVVFARSEDDGARHIVMEFQDEHGNPIADTVNGIAIAGTDFQKVPVILPR